MKHLSEERAMAARMITTSGDVAYVPLTKGYFAVIDAADAHLVGGVNWCANVKHRADGSIRAVYAMRMAARDGGGQVNVKMHRVIMGARGAVEVDHMDADGLNNTRSNLRLATSAENARNVRLQCNNSSGFKGVCWDAASGRWRVQIGLGSKRLHIGRFDSIDDAAAAYASASQKIHGEFGRIA